MPAAKRKTKTSASSRSFVCGAGLTVTNPDKCEHCGADENGTCGRLPDVLQQKIYMLRASLSEMIEAYGSDDGRGPIPIIERAKAATKAAES